jgi:hypothetical protein
MPPSPTLISSGAPTACWWQFDHSPPTSARYWWAKCWRVILTMRTERGSTLESYVRSAARDQYAGAGRGDLQHGLQRGCTVLDGLADSYSGMMAVDVTSVCCFCTAPLFAVHGAHFIAEIVDPGGSGLLVSCWACRCCLSSRMDESSLSTKFRGYVFSRVRPMMMQPVATGQSHQHTLSAIALTRPSSFPGPRNHTSRLLSER